MDDQGITPLVSGTTMPDDIGRQVFCQNGIESMQTLGMFE